MVKEFGDSLIHCGLPPFAGIGHHYAGLALFKYGHGNCQKALLHFERAMSLCPPCYRSRVLLSIASTAGIIEKDDSRYYQTCQSVASLSDDLYSYAQARQALAIGLGKDGKHEQAAAELESLYRLVSSRSDLLYLPADIANSAAEELRLTGKLWLAKEYSDEAMRSPYAPSYPEWMETQAQINERQAVKRMVAVFRHPKPTRDQIVLADAWAEHDEFLRRHHDQFDLGSVIALTRYAQGLL
jgi:hypothetical protein